MKKYLKNEKGITLVALVITIIILLILAGISISALTNTGLFGKVKEAKETSIKAQLEEEIVLAIQEIQIEEIPKGNNVTLETLANGQLAEKLEEITADVEDDEIVGEYKGYNYTIDSNFKVKIGDKSEGIKPKGKAEILTTGYMFEGNGTVQIKVTANIEGGTITEIKAPSEATLAIDTSETEKTYAVRQNGIYVFTILSDNGKKVNVTAKVDKFLSAPHINISDVKGNEFTINVDNNYPADAITEFRYYVDGEVKSQGTTEKSYKVTGLAEETEYKNIKVVAYINSNTSIESNVETATTTMIGEIPYSWDELSEIAHAISNTKSITNDSEEARVTVNGQEKILTVGDVAKVDGKKVRILGFNHDELTNPTAYGTTTATGKAGISFEYVSFLTKSNTSQEEWKNCIINKKLNEEIYKSLSIKGKIKQVKKDYITVYNRADTAISNDYLWLLSCSEIWGDTCLTGKKSGYSVAAEEGNEYKYYKMGNPNIYSQTDCTKKPSISDSSSWWLRSPVYESGSEYSLVNSNGFFTNDYTSGNYGIAPGFCI